MDSNDCISNDSHKEIADLQELTKQKDAHINALAVRIKELNDASLQLEAQYQTELQEMKGLAHHHMEAYEKEKNTNRELLQTIDEMQNLLLDGQKAQQDLEETIKRATTEYQKTVKSKNETIKNLEADITKLKAKAVAKVQEDFSREFDHQFPSASTTYKIFRSNMSLPQIYNEFVILQEELDESRNENNLLKEQISQLVEEAENKTPFIHQKVQESRKSLQTIKDLNLQLTKVTSEKDMLIEENNNLVQSNAQLRREISRLEQSSQDLALQVRSLIKAVYEAKGFEVTSQSRTPDKVKEESAANSIITKYLVTFEDIESLQLNNQRLIASIRELATENENLASKLEMKEKVTQQELDKAFEEIQKLQEERRRQTEALEELMEAKGIFKSIGLASGKSPGSTFTDPNKILNDTIDELKESLKKIEVETCASKADHHQKLKDLSDDLNHYRHEYAMMQAEKAKVESESEYIQEKMKLIQANYEFLKKENTRLTDRNSKLSVKLARAEGNLAAFKQEISELKSNHEDFKANIQSLQSERDQLRNNESLLTQERDALIKDCIEKSKLASTLQKINENFSRLESDSSRGLHLQIEKLEKEVEFYKNKLSEEEQKNEKLNQTYFKQISDLKLKMEDELKKNANLQEAVISSEGRFHAAERELKALKIDEAQFKANIKGSSDNSDQKIQQMEKRLSESEGIVKTLAEENESLKNAVEEQKSKKKELAMEARKRISALTAQKKTLTDEKNEALKKVEELETTLTTTRTKVDNLTRVNQELRERINLLDQNVKENSLRLKNIAAGSAVKLNRLKVLEESHARMAQQQFQAQISSTHVRTTSSDPTRPQASTSMFIDPSSNVPSSSSSTGVVRHPVFPQKQEPPTPKATPRASIRPLLVSRASAIPRSNPSHSSNVAVVAVQPNTEDSAQLVPQATVAPTVIAASTAATSSSEPIMSVSTSTSSVSASTSSIPLSSSSPANSSEMQLPMTSSEATPQTDRSTRSEPKITSSEISLNQEASITTSDDSSEISRPGLKRQRESPSTSGPQEDLDVKKVKLDSTASSQEIQQEYINEQSQHAASGDSREGNESSEGNDQEEGEDEEVEKEAAEDEEDEAEVEEIEVEEVEVEESDEEEEEESEQEEESNEEEEEEESEQEEESDQEHEEEEEEGDAEVEEVEVEESDEEEEADEDDEADGGSVNEEAGDEIEEQSMDNQEEAEAEEEDNNNETSEKVERRGEPQTIEESQKMVTQEDQMDEDMNCSTENKEGDDKSEEVRERQDEDEDASENIASAIIEEIMTLID